MSRASLVRLPPQSIRVIDADEEIFLLYSDLQRASSSNIPNSDGLGQVDSSKDTMTLEFDIESLVSLEKEKEQPIVAGRRGKRTLRTVPKKQARTTTISVELVQDKTTLRTRKGDTGSVLWKVTLEFAKLVLSQTHTRSVDSFLDTALLKEATVIELGAGTGILSVLLSPLMKRYVVTDMEPLLPLIRKNVNLNHTPTSSDHSIVIAPLDWQVLSSTPLERRHYLLPLPSRDHYDLIIAADCIYHPSLIAPFITTLSSLTFPSPRSNTGNDHIGPSPPTDGTMVLVIVQLREVDVMREFLEAWLKDTSDPRCTWEIWRAGDDPGLLGRGYAVWVGWKKPRHDTVH